MAENTQVAVVLGVGPKNGLGAALSRRMSQEGLHVLVSGRTESSLSAVVEEVQSLGGKASLCVADATSEQDIEQLFEEARSLGAISVAIYNAGNNFPGTIIDMDADYFESTWRVCCFGGFLFGRKAVRSMQASGGTLIFTGASASLRGRANFGAFNSAKGALRNLAQAMAKEYAEQGIHVGHVVIDGPINGDKITEGFPAYAERLGEGGLINLEQIAESFAYLYRQPPTAWTFELDLRTSQERW
jgi:NAD(P)-dependent dehydrogenase (short-subunit alcohol dehydrogenase family)|tara:strand:- start:2140 stop:2871 length:732 start_codon:yes stop_codon:yes gene_type:complete